MKTPALRKSKYYIMLAVSDITTTVAPLTHRWKRRKKTNCLLHFRVLFLRGSRAGFKARAILVLRLRTANLL